MYIEQARQAKTDFWRYIIGIIIIFAGLFIAQIPQVIAIFIKAGPDIIGMTQTEMMTVLDSNLNLFLMMLGFCGGLGALFFCVRVLHQQKITSLTTARHKIDWRRFFFGFMLIAVFVGGSTGIDYYLNPEHYTWNFELVPFLILSAIAIVMVPLQTSFEEYLFRGYLMQGIGLAAKNRWVPLVVTSVIFGCMHLANPEIDKLGYLILFDYIAFGFLFGIIALMDDGLELSLGFHAGNNLIIALLVTADWTAFQTHSVLKDVSEPSYTWTNMLTTIGLFAVVLFIMSKKYHWTGWKNKLFGKLDPAKETQDIE